MVGLQDLSQARSRWGSDAADGFMSLFQTKLVLSGIGDSAHAGEHLAGARRIRPPGGLFDARDGARAMSGSARTTTTSRSATRPRGSGCSTPGEIAKLPPGQGLLLRGADWGLIGLTRWFESPPFSAAAFLTETS